MLLTRLTAFALLAAAWCLSSNAELFYDVACQGVNNEPKCPKEHHIRVVSVEHGVQSSKICDARNSPAPVSSENRLHRLMLPWVKMVCDGWQSCRLPKPNERMFADGQMNDDFMQVTYACEGNEANLRTVLACDGEIAKASCENKAIRVVRSNYGRLDTETCTNKSSVMTFCRSYTATMRLTQWCNGEEECELLVGKRALGFPVLCDTNPKYLIMQYVCE